MAVKQDTYGLPDETLQLIASSPDFGFLLPQQGTTAQFATPDVRRSDLISALRNIPGPANPGFTRYANKANGPALNVNLRNTLGAISPAKLTMQKYVAPEVTLPGGDTQVPYTPPTTPVVPDVIVPGVISPDLDPVLPDPDPVVPDPVVPDPVNPDPVEPQPEPESDPSIPTDSIELPPVKELEDKSFWDDSGDPSIYTDPIISDIPDEIRPEDIAPITPTNPIELPDLPDVKDLVDASYWDEIDTPDVVGPTRGQPELPEEFDQYLQPEVAPETVMPEPVAPEPEPYVPDWYMPEPSFPEQDFPEPSPEPTNDEAAFIDAWLADQFGDLGGYGTNDISFGFNGSEDGGKYGDFGGSFGGGGKGFDDILYVSSF